jgi:hypothetical protein
MRPRHFDVAPALFSEPTLAPHLCQVNPFGGGDFAGIVKRDFIQEGTAVGQVELGLFVN